MNDLHLIQKSAGKAGELLGVNDWYDDLVFLRIWKELFTLCGYDESLMRHWIQTPNKHLNDKVPANLITTAEGMEKVLDAIIFYNYH